MSTVNLMLVGVDFTPCSANALRQAIRLAEVSHSHVRVVHVIDTLVVVDLERAVSPLQAHIRDGLTEEARIAWRSFAAELPGAEDLPFDVHINNRTVGILDAVREHKADLLVLGAFGHRRPDVGVGTIASACVRHAMTDVMLVRDTQVGPFKCMVAAVDFSDTSRRALMQAARLASTEQAELHVLHVYHSPWDRLSYLTPTSGNPERIDEHRLEVERKLVELAGEVSAANQHLKVTVRCFEKMGHRSGINDYAKSVGADLITIGTRGRSNFRDILLGSTAEKTLQNSQCSVWAVTPWTGAGPAQAIT